jgi:hypothetical protein
MDLRSFRMLWGLVPLLRVSCDGDFLKSNLGSGGELQR